MNPTPNPNPTPTPTPHPTPFDLKVSAVGKYAHTAGTGSAANGKAGSFGAVNVGYGEMAKLQFAFYWSATGEEVDLPEI